MISGNFIMEDDVTNMPMEEAQRRSIERARGKARAGEKPMFE